MHGDDTLLTAGARYRATASLAATPANITSTTVELGFKPRFVIIKCSNAAVDWIVFDSERGGSANLRPNDTDAEASTPTITFGDTGFTVAGNANNETNGGLNYIYAAFADRPGNNWDVNNIVTNEGLTTSKDNFDVVTYTGNGGTTQKIGGAVYSSFASGATSAIHQIPMPLMDLPLLSLAHKIQL